ncbi:MAG: hypothetical protein RIQ29_180 [Pseudomonadota bacterium]|jgi:uncharacterized MAPEG superfamily protein
MSTALWCLLIAGWLPIVCAGIAKWGASDFDNRHPREWLAKQEGHRQRANGAQQNSWEAFTWFGVAVVVAMLTKADPGKVDDLALLFIGARVLYIGFYLANMSSARTLAWLGGFITTIVIFASGG